MRSFLFLVLTTNLFWTSAHAADLIIPPEHEVDARFAPTSLADYPGELKWDGFYGGLSFGYSFGDYIDLRITQATAGATASAQDFVDTDGIIGGLFVGYNMPWNHFIVGAEADFEITSVEGDLAINGGGTASYTLVSQGSLRARFGYDIGPALVFSTIGLVIADIEYSAIAVDGSGGSDGAIEYGLALGVGADYALTRDFFLRAEYRYTHFAETEFENRAGTYTFDFDTKFHEIRFGIGSKF